MFNRRRLWQMAVATGALALLAGCKVVPSGPAQSTPAPGPSALPADGQRHRIALLVPLAGPNAAAGMGLANAANMALLDTGAKNLRITTYDTSTGVPSAAAKAVADGNRLILGPLLGDEVPAVAATAKPARVPVIAFSNDITAAEPGVFVMGNIPGEAVARTVRYAKAHGSARFAALIPAGTYGERVSVALQDAVRINGGTMVGLESYNRGAGTLASALTRLNRRGAYDSLLVADTGRVGAQVAALGHNNARIIGTELWNGDAAVAASTALKGAWFAAPPDGRFRQFSQSYKARFGNNPARIATLGYDAVLLTLRLSRDWRVGSPLPTERLMDRGGFLGLDGVFRFNGNGVIDRALEVRELRGPGVTVVSPAPTRFAE